MSRSILHAYTSCATDDLDDIFAGVATSPDEFRRWLEAVVDKADGNAEDILMAVATEFWRIFSENDEEFLIEANSAAYRAVEGKVPLFELVGGPGTYNVRSPFDYFTDRAFELLRDIEAEEGLPGHPASGLEPTIRISPSLIR